jgi:hypothetical protein
LIKDSGTPNIDGWRLPAEELEMKIAHVIAKKVKASSFIGSLIPDTTAAKIADAKALIGVMSDEIKSWLKLVGRVDLKAGELTILLDETKVAKTLGCDRELMSPNELTFQAQFQLRKRGVETKLIFADAPSCRDETLIHNIAKAHLWFEQIKSGKTFAQIAAEDTTSKRRIQQMIDLAFLAPDIIRDVMDGTQPFGFTSDWCLRHTIPTSWPEQRKLIATL